MFAWVKINAERNGVKDIQYSLGTDMTLDGRISYDTRTQEMHLDQLSDGASPAATRDFMEAFKGRLQAEPWPTDCAVCVRYDRTQDEEASMLRRWEMQAQGSFMRLG